MAVVATDDRRVTITLDESGESASFALDAIGPRERHVDRLRGRDRAGTDRERATDHGFPRRCWRAPSRSRRGCHRRPRSRWPSRSRCSGRRRASPRSTGLSPVSSAENDYVGVASGVMDQVASAAGVAGHAIRIDCRSLEWRPVRLPIREVAIVVCHSGSSRRLDTSAYNARRAECDRAVAEIAAIEPRVTSLRDVDVALLAAAEPHMDPVAARRARHVVGENARVLETEVALAAGDLAAVGRLFAESHASLRDLFEVSSPELDALVEIADSTDGVVAARMTGAGFGGSTVNLVRHGQVGRVSRGHRAGLPATYRSRPDRVRGRCRRRGGVHGRLTSGWGADVARRPKASRMRPRSFDATREHHRGSGHRSEPKSSPSDALEWHHFERVGLGGTAARERAGCGPGAGGSAARRTRAWPISRARSRSTPRWPRTTSLARSPTSADSAERASCRPKRSQTLVDGLAALAGDVAAGRLDLGPDARRRPHERRGGPGRRRSGRWPVGSTRVARGTTRSPPTCGCGRAASIDDLDAALLDFERALVGLAEREGIGRPARHDPHPAGPAGAVRASPARLRRDGRA